MCSLKATACTWFVWSRGTRQGVKSFSACKAGNNSMVLLVVGRLRCVVHVAMIMCSMKLVADVDMGANQQNRHI